MIDKHGREISYLRISLTELCNFRCRYCMPEEGVEKKCHSEMMTEEELVCLVRAAAALGIRKLRVTGGEPLIKKNIVSICRTLSSIPGIDKARQGGQIRDGFCQPDGGKRTEHPDYAALRRVHGGIRGQLRGDGRKRAYGLPGKRQHPQFR